MPCKIEIKNNLTTTVETRSNPGFNMSLVNAKKLASEINDDYKTPVVEFFSEADAVSRRVDIPSSLVDLYYNHELEIETEEARTAQMDDAVRAGVEYGEDYLFLQKEESALSVASPETLQKVKEVLKKMGVNIESLAEYAKTSSVKVSGVNALADLVRGVIAVAEGKEDVALTEEMVHVATAIIEQKNPSLVTEMISKIDRFKIYKETLEQYKNNKAYQLPNGKPDIRKIKKEAVDKLIAELIINGNTGDGSFPELASEENRSIVRRWWNAITDFFRGMYKSANISIFEETAKQIIEGGVEGQVSDIIGGTMYAQRRAPYIKKGVEELFNSNPELANQVYQALGFKQVYHGSKTTEKYSEYKIPVNKGVDSLGSFFTSDLDGALMFTPDFIDESPIAKDVKESTGKVTYKKDRSYVKKEYLKLQNPYSVDIRKWEDNSWINDFVKGDFSIYNFNEVPSEIVDRVKKILIDRGHDGIYIAKDFYVGNMESRYDQYIVFDPNKTLKQQKQQALQLYSQYLDSIFPESKVKDVVYHDTDVKFDKFQSRRGIYFNVTKEGGFSGALYKIAAIINLKNPAIEDMDSYGGENTNEVFPNNDGVIGTDVTKTIRGEYIVSKPEQIHILGNENDVQGFREFVESGASGEGIFFQLTEPTKAQKEVQRRILETDQALRKGEIDPETDVLTLGDSDATNFYEYRQPDGTYKRVLKRVTDRVKRYYKDRFGDTAFSKEEKAFNEFKRTLGVKYHGYFEEIHDRFFNKDGTRKSNPEPRPDIRDQVDAEVYSKLEKYYTALIESRSKGGKNILVFSEVRVYDPREQEAGTIDLLIVDEDGTGNIFDWKFMSVAEGQKDVQWYKQEAYNIQLKRYRDMLLANYGVKKIGMNRAVPILFQIKPLDKRVEGSKPTLTGINVGSVDTTKIEDLRLVPISEKTESTGFESLDKFIAQLNSVLDKISNRKATSDEEREFKRERLNIVREAIRVAQGTMNIKPVIDVMLVMMKEGENLINDYNVIYKNANAQSNDFTNKQLSDFSSELRDFVAISEVFGRIGENIGKLIYSKDMDTTNMSEEEISGRKELLRDVEEKAKEIIQSRQEVFDIAGKFADKYMGLRNLVSGLLNPEAVVKGLGSFFRTVSEIPLRSVQILYKLTENAKSRASADAKIEVDELMKIREKLAARGGDLRALIKKIYRKDDKGNFVNKLIYKYSPEFGDGVRDNALEENRSKQWLKDNIDVTAYLKEASALLEKRVDQINKDYANNEELRDRLILQERQKWDITRADFNGWSNYVIMRHPLPKWLSEEYKELQKDQDLLDLYNFITDINDKASDSGYLTNQGISTFLPWVRKSMAESLAWDFSLSTVMNFGKKLSLRADDVGRGKIDSLTNELENAIPKYYTTDFTQLPGGELDTSEVSEDLFANMVLYIGHMNKYKYLSEVEGQIELIKTIETFKQHLETANNGNVVIRNGVVDPQSGNEENTKIYDQFMRSVLYDQKYPLDDTDVTLSTGPMQFVKKTINKTAKHFGGQEIFEVSDEPGSISLVKTMETMNRYFQLKALGLEFVSGAVNWFGTNVQLAAQSGNYFNRGEVLTKQYKLLGNNLNKNEQDLFVELVDTFMPLREDPNYENFKKAGMSELTKRDFGDILMFFMRTPEQFTEKAVFMTLLDNVMVENGRFENIRDVVKRKYADQRKGSSASQLREIDRQIENDVNQLKKESSIGATMKIEDGKLVIPGFDLNNRDEIQRLTKLTRTISTNATGGINAENVNRAQMNIWFKSAMVFKSWIPGLAFTRFDHLRKISDDFSVTINEDGTTEGERYDIGRLRLFAYVLGTTVTQQSNNILNIINLNDKGLIEIDRMFEKFTEEYFQRTGQTLNMTREEFIDLIRTNLRNQLNEFAITLSLMGLAFSMGMLAPDDDEDKATKNLFRYGQRVVDKFVSELTFFINPVEFQGILEGNLIPAIGVVTDATRFVSHFTKQVTGFDVSDPEKSFEDVQKDAQPIKNLAKMFPVSKSLINYLAMFDEEFAKEYDITIPKNPPK